MFTRWGLECNSQDNTVTSLYTHTHKCLCVCVCVCVVLYMNVCVCVCVCICVIYVCVCVWCVCVCVRVCVMKHLRASSSLMSKSFSDAPLWPSLFDFCKGKIKR